MGPRASRNSRNKHHLFACATQTKKKKEKSECEIYKLHQTTRHPSCFLHLWRCDDEAAKKQECHPQMLQQLMLKAQRRSRQAIELDIHMVLHFSLEGRQHRSVTLIQLPSRRQKDLSRAKRKGQNEAKMMKGIWDIDVDASQFSFNIIPTYQCKQDFRSSRTAQ